MISKILSLIFGTKADKLKSKIDKKRFEAVQLQRNGNIREYSKKMTEIHDLEIQLHELSKNNL